MSRRIAWTGLVLLWTLALEFPVPEPEWEEQDRETYLTAKLIVGKTGHVGVYALLASLVVWVTPVDGSRRILILLLVGHGALTEWLQVLLYPICFRGGSLGDVGLDTLGIVIGVAVTWRWWRE